MVFAEGARRRQQLRHALLAGLVGLTVVALSGQSAAAVGPTTLSSETFAGSTTSTQWVRPTSAGGSSITNSACLTASPDTAGSPIPGCSTTAIDPAGSGTLRLTTNTTSQVGSLYSTRSVPTSKGLDIVFTSYQWSKNAGRLQAGDGIALVLAATDPANPSPPAVLASQGGALGYALDGKSVPGAIKPGVSYGYLGLGLDVYGNFSYSLYGNSCPAVGEITGTNTQPSNGGSVYATANAVTVRGPGNGTAGYCELPTTSDTGHPYLSGYSTSIVASGLLDSPAATARPSGVPVEVALNPSSAAVTTPTGLSVPARSWLVQVTPQGGTAQQMIGGLPTAAELTTLGFPTSWFDPTTGLPYQLSYGWTASTGASAEFHEINNESISTLNGPLPTYQLAVSDDHAGTVAPGTSFAASITPSLAPAGGSEGAPSLVTATFPPGLTPPSAAFTTAAGYACTPNALVVTCTFTPSAEVTAGTVYPALVIPVTASSTLASYQITATVSSRDSSPITASHAVAVGVAATATAAALAPTGSDPAVPLSFAAILLASGASILTTRRRSRAH